MNITERMSHFNVPSVSVTYSGINEKQSSPELKIAGFWAFSATGETDFELFRNITFFKRSGSDPAPTQKPDSIKSISLSGFFCLQNTVRTRFL